MEMESDGRSLVCNATVHLDLLAVGLQGVAGLKQVFTTLESSPSALTVTVCGVTPLLLVYFLEVFFFVIKKGKMPQIFLARLRLQATAAVEAAAVLQPE